MTEFFSLVNNSVCNCWELCFQPVFNLFKEILIFTFWRWQNNINFWDFHGFKCDAIHVEYSFAAFHSIFERYKQGVLRPSWSVKALKGTVANPVSEFNEFKPRLKSSKNRFQFSGGLNLEKCNSILSGTNNIWAAAQIHVVF